MNGIYLDSSATTKPKQEVIDAMMPYLTEKWYNPSSLYSNAVQVRKDIEAARKTIADFINCEPEEIYFTSGASESNSWAIRGFCDKASEEGFSSAVITTNIEHKSINECLKNLYNIGILGEMHYIPVDKYGLVQIDKMKDVFNYYCSKPDIYYDTYEVLTSVQLANNEIGTIQDIKTISKLVHRYGSILHVDATQALGKISIDVKEMGIDMMSASAHKLGAVKGTGFLYIKNGIEIAPLIYGSQERGQRGGTENVAGIIGMAKAIELCDLDSVNSVGIKYTDVMQSVRNYFIECLNNKFGCKLNGDVVHRLPNNINVTFPQNVTGEALLYILDLDDINISVGSACNSKSIKPSHVLKAIGLTDEEAARTIRISLPFIFGYSVMQYNDMIDNFMDELNKAIKLLESEV